MSALHYNTVEMLLLLLLLLQFVDYLSMSRALVTSAVAATLQGRLQQTHLTTD